MALGTVFNLNFVTRGASSLVKTRSLITGIGQASYVTFNAANRAFSTFDKMTGKTVSRLTRLAVGGTALYGAFRMLNYSLIESNSLIKTHTILLETLVGNKSKAAEFITTIQDLSAAYGADMSEMMKSAKGMIQVMQQAGNVKTTDLERIMNLMMSVSMLEPENRGLSYVAFSFREMFQGLGRMDFRSLRSRLEINLGAELEQAIVAAIRSGDVTGAVDLIEQGFAGVGIRSAQIMGRVLREGVTQNIARTAAYIQRLFQILGRQAFESLATPLWKLNEFIKQYFIGDGLKKLTQIGARLNNKFMKPFVDMLSELGSALYNVREEGFEALKSTMSGMHAVVSGIFGVMAQFFKGLFGAKYGFEGYDGTLKSLVSNMKAFGEVMQDVGAWIKDFEPGIHALGESINNLVTSLAKLFNMGVAKNEGNALKRIAEAGIGLTTGAFNVAAGGINAANNMTGGLAGMAATTIGSTLLIRALMGGKGGGAASMAATAASLAPSVLPLAGEIMGGETKKQRKARLIRENNLRMAGGSIKGTPGAPFGSYETYSPRTDLTRGVVGTRMDFAPNEYKRRLALLGKKHGIKLTPGMTQAQIADAIANKGYSQKVLDAQRLKPGSPKTAKEFFERLHTKSKRSAPPKSSLATKMAAADIYKQMGLAKSKSFIKPVDIVGITHATKTMGVMGRTTPTIAPSVPPSGWQAVKAGTMRTASWANVGLTGKGLFDVMKGIPGKILEAVKSPFAKLAPILAKIGIAANSTTLLIGGLGVAIGALTVGGWALYKTIAARKEEEAAITRIQKERNDQVALQKIERYAYKYGIRGNQLSRVASQEPQKMMQMAMAQAGLKHMGYETGGMYTTLMSKMFNADSNLNIFKTKEGREWAAAKGINEEYWNQPKVQQQIKMIHDIEMKGIEFLDKDNKEKLQKYLKMWLEGVQKNNVEGIFSDARNPDGSPKGPHSLSKQGVNERNTSVLGSILGL